MRETLIASAVADESTIIEGRWFHVPPVAGAIIEQPDVLLPVSHRAIARWSRAMVPTASFNQED